MRVWRGNTTGTFTSPTVPKECTITYFIITNHASGSVVINLSVGGFAGPRTSLCPANLTLSVGQTYTGGNVYLLVDEYVYLTVTGGSIDYYFAVPGNV